MAITYNSTSYTNENSSSLSTLTWAHTCNASDKKLVVAVGGRATISGITYNGVAMTLMAYRNNDFSYEYTAIYYLDNPPTGVSYNIVVTYSAANSYRMGAAVGIGGCALGFGAEADSSSQAGNGVLVTQLITTTEANSDILFPFWRNNESTSITFGSGQSILVQNTANNGCFYIQKKSTTTAGLNSVTVTDSATYNKVLIAIEIPSATLLTNLVAYYKLDDVNDSTGNGYTLTNNNGAIFDTGKIGNGVDFGSSNTSKSLANSSFMGMTYASNTSLSCWGKIITQPSSGGQYAFAGIFFNTYPGRQSTIYYQNASGTYKLGIGQSTLYAYTLTVGAWYHFVVTWNNGVASQLYVNGTLLFSDTVSTANYTPYSPGGLAIGMLASGNYASCQVDEVGIWNRVLTSTEVSQLYNSGTGLQYPFVIVPVTNTNQGFFSFFK